MTIFDKFSLELFEVSQNEIDMGFAGLHGRGRIKQEPPIERELYLTLEEVYKGSTKKMKISRRVSCFQLVLFTSINPFTPKMYY